MSVIEDVYRDREDLARVLKKHTGIRKMVEDLYPDNAHFIYELLQNAEDTGATETKFNLTAGQLTFEHNGRPFELSDIAAITDIGEGTKASDVDKIGQFGIGFKSVFAYSESPRIWSTTYSFQISDLVLPTELEGTIGDGTRFEFPFNNPKKEAAIAFEEVKRGLQELAENTLLFLSSIESIRWHIEGTGTGEVLRIAHSEEHIEILRQDDELSDKSVHFLRFKEPVRELENQYVAIAYELELLPKRKRLDSAKPLADQFRIVSAKPGSVAVFFPAQKERSGLRFHLHAPFVPELSRASVKETPANTPLFEQLAELTASSLYVIRDKGLLTEEFLSVLPNPHDELPSRYAPIRTAIINEMNEQPLTPTYLGKHSSAQSLLQARASLKSLLDPADLEILMRYKKGDRIVQPEWAIGARQKNSDAERLLSGLSITEWGIEEFSKLILKRLDETEGHWDDYEDEWISYPDKKIQNWISSKDNGWHQSLYALMYGEVDMYSWNWDRIHIVRLSSGDYSTGPKSYFPTYELEQDAVLPRVSGALYTSGKSKNEQKLAREFLEKIGVREVGELEQVKAILKARYTYEAEPPSVKNYKKDLRRFMSLLEENKTCAEVLRGYWILKRSDENWAKPDQVYIDTPYVETGLSQYYQNIGEESNFGALSAEYREWGISVKKLVDFCNALGVVNCLTVERTTCYGNPSWTWLSSVPGERNTSPINRDFIIPQLEKAVENPSIEVSRLLWVTICGFPKYPSPLEAVYRRNASNGAHSADSQLVNQLKSLAWVPQGGEKFVCPSDADPALLPEGFAFDPGWEWVKRLKFGQSKKDRRKAEIEKNLEAIAKREKTKEVARALGFENDQILKDAQWFASLSDNERLEYKDQHERRKQVVLPESAPSNLGRRSERAIEQAKNAPDRETEKRLRSVSKARESVKKDTQVYLREQYTNDDDEMICQICKDELPFKLEEGVYYFEAVEFISSLGKYHKQNYLALCPNHAAMFLYANEAKNEIAESFTLLGGSDLEIVLAGRNMAVYFTERHKVDIKAAMTSEGSQTDDE